MGEAWIAIGGVVSGGFVTVLASTANALVAEHIKNRREEKLDVARKELLLKLLNGPNPWRKLSTLARVIGANDDLTIRLLIELGARGSEGEQIVWALISRVPLSEAP